MPAQPYTLTPAQLLLQAERKAAKLAKKLAATESLNGSSSSPQSQARILRRSWIDVKSSRTSNGEDCQDKYRRRVKIVSWNMLAQTLVRRELFPGSDCLRWGDRKSMLLAELAEQTETDIICLQECDRLGDLLPSLPSHSFIRASGPGKLHGLVILYKSNRFFVKSSQAVHLDEEVLDDSEQSPLEGNERRRRGGSRQTKNVGLVVGLQEVEGGDGIVIATTHLFWHPKFIYERVRQSLLLVRAIRRFQKEHGIEHWPAVLAGDLNTQPSEATYQLLTDPNRPLPRSLVDEIDASRLVHVSVDKIGSIPSPPATTSLDVGSSAQSADTQSTTGTGANTPTSTTTPQSQPFIKPTEKNDDEGELPDKDERSIANTRIPTEDDGIYTAEQLVKLAQEVLEGSGARSAYGSNNWSGEGGTETYDTRGGLKGLEGSSGGLEPAYTCFTPLFKLTLDYLFLLPSLRWPQADGFVVEFTRLLEPPKKALLGDGLPRKGISASDHLAVGCEVSW